MNSIMIIKPYFYAGHWVFDDPEVNLVREPFVMGVDNMITDLVESFKNPEDGFVILFSDKPFPGHMFVIDRLYEEYDGFWYKSEELKMEGWLCPALFKYFDQAPKHIYTQLKEA